MTFTPYEFGKIMSVNMSCATGSASFGAISAFLLYLAVIVNMAQSKSSVRINNRPIIGVLAQETEESYEKYGDSYFFASYVKYLEAGGARVVPIRINKADEYYSQLFKSINGVLFPGGGASLTTSGYARAGKILFNLATEANLAGDYFPIWGTCLGFQFLTVLVSGKNLLTTVDGENLALPLDLVEPGYRDSYIFGMAPEDVIQALRKENVTANNHHYAITPEKFSKDENLRSFFKVLSTNFDRKGKKFISTMEGMKFPYWGVQFHPEKNIFTWDTAYNWDHSADAIKVTQYFADFFVDRARLSNHTFPSPELEQASVIENYTPVYLESLYPYASIYTFNFTKAQ